SGAATALTNYVKVSLKATDDRSSITQFCLKTSSSAPASGDSCCVNVNAPNPGLTPNINLNLVNFPYMLGWVPGTYTIYAWVRDDEGNISSLTAAGAGTSGTDKATITYSPGTPSTVVNTSSTAGDSPSSPATQGDLTASSGSDVFIRWDVSTS